MRTWSWRHIFWRDIEWLHGLQGVDPDLRQAVWPLLLRVVPLNSTDAERQLLCSELGQSHERLLAEAQVKPVLCK